MFDEILKGGVLAATALAGYHHTLYPALMAGIGLSRPISPPAKLVDPATAPHVSVVMPAYNEAHFIANKIRALAAQRYPHDRMTVLIGCDGSTDESADIALRAAAAYPGLDVRLLRFRENRGKVAVLNDLMNLAEGDIVIMSDVSAMPSPDALARAVAWFADPTIGAVGGGYGLPADASAGERIYWRVQTAVKKGESRIGGLIGAHGAFYAIRRSLWRPLDADIINDDFVVPMRVAMAGHRTLYDPGITVMEGEATDEGTDGRRRVRIGAGNLQQLLRLKSAFAPSRPGLAFCFASGKTLRVACPALLFIAAAGSAWFAGTDPLFDLLAAGFLLAGALAVLDGKAGIAGRLMRYLITGHWANLLGALTYLRGGKRGWRGRATDLSKPDSIVPAMKRLTDVLGACVGLTLTAPLFPLIAIAIKLESPGPVFFRQLRVGRALYDRTDLFEMIKFRSMRTDAETKSGPVWAQKSDPRVTRVGKVLRKTRLDELPQFLNVIRGDMSLIGPRPERPSFCRRLEREIPYYIERTTGLRPGITGLAQVNQGYDETLDDVRRKILYDYSYGVCLNRMRDWLRADFGIVFKTIGVMAFGRGR